ncbi:MAG: tetratricopeptide repeat protein, partial [Deltaproteobacteria bacterium]|nr:tetratricopeptide repeat protein [Deltaproteobacteria bacterium]
AVRALETEVALVRNTVVMGRYDDALARLQPLQPQVVELEYPPLQAAAALALGRIEEGRGNASEAEAALRESFDVAMEAGAFGLAAEAGTTLTGVVGDDQARYGEGLVWGELSVGLTRGHPAARHLRASASLAVARIYQDQGKLDRAAEGYQHAYDETVALHGPDHPVALAARHNLGSVLYLQGQFEAAAAQHRRTIESMRRVLGPEHPDVAIAQSNLANALNSAGRYDEAIQEHQAALAIQERALGSDHTEVAVSRSNLGAVLLRQGKYAEAGTEFELALDIATKTLGAEHPDLATYHTNVGAVAAMTGALARARPHLETAMTLRAAALGEDHREVAMARSNLAQILTALGELDPAEQQLRLAVGSMERTAPDHPDLAGLYHDLASLALERERFDEAITLSRTALQMLETRVAPDHPRELPLRLTLGTVLMQSGDYEAAVEELRHAAELGTRTVGATHPQVMQARLRRAAARYGQGDRDAAVRLQSAALQDIGPALEANAHPTIGDLIALGRAALRAKHPNDALAPLERAVEAAVAHEVDDRLATARLVLAEALWASKTDRVRARTLAREAAAREPTDGEAATKAQAWLDAHPG